MNKLPPIEQLRGRPIGRVLIKMGLLTREKVHQCLDVQKQRQATGHKNVPLGQIFVELGLVEERQLHIALAAQRGMEFINLSDMDIPPNALEKVQGQMAKTYRVVPVEFKQESNELVVAVDKADSFRATDDLSTLLGMKVTAKITDPQAIDAALTKYYQQKDESEGINELISEIQQDGFLAEFE